MDTTYELAVYLANNGFGTLGQDIFVNQIPAQTKGIYISHVGGNLALYTPMQDSVVNIYVKDTSASNGASTISSIKNFVHRMVATETANSYIYSMLVVGDVENVNRDMDGNAIYKITVTIKCKDNSLIS